MHIHSPARRAWSTRTAALVAVLGMVVAAGAVAAVRIAFAASTSGEFNYAEALQDSMLFYESQRSGQAARRQPGHAGAATPT